MPDIPVPNIKEYYIKDGTKLFLYEFYGKPVQIINEEGVIIEQRPRIRKKGFNSEKAAKTAAQKRVQAEYNGDKSEDMTVKELFDKYIANCIANGEKDNSIKAYTTIINHWCLSEIGGLKLEKINRYHAEEIGNTIKTSGNAPSTIKKYIREIKKMFTFGVNKEYISKNPFNVVDTIRSVEQVRPHKAFTKEETQKILEACKDNFVLYPFVIIAAHTGMRNSEICGLTWDDVSFENKTITIDKQLLMHIDKQLYLDSPKHNTKGTITIDDSLIEFLKDYKAKVKRKKYSKDKNGRLINGNSFSFVLVAEDGTPLINNMIDKKAEAIADKEGIKFTPHDLRDTYASLYFHKNPQDLKFIQKQLRHKNGSTTLNKYIQLIENTPQTENEKLNDVFGSI